MGSDATVLRKGDHVSFHVRDIYLPEPAEFKEFLDPDTEVLGRIVGFSDAEPSPGVFAVVQTNERSKVIVPVGDLLTIERGRAGKSAKYRGH